MDPRLMKRATLPGVGVAKGMGRTLREGAVSGAADSVVNMALAGPRVMQMPPMQREVTKAALGGKALADAAGGAFGALVRPDGAVVRAAGGVSGSLKRYILPK